MKVAHRLAALALVATSVALVDAPAASAAVSVSVSGTTITITATGDVTISFTCASSNVAVNNTPVSPAVTCAQLSHVTVNGDISGQTVYATQLTDGSFAMKPALTATLGGGTDVVTATDSADTLDMGAGFDYVYINPVGVADVSIDMGADEGWVAFNGSPGNDTYVLSSSTTNATMTWTGTGVPVVYAFANADIVSADGGAGNDTFTSTALTNASTVDRFDATGAAGNDTFTTGNGPDHNLSGGSGNNVFNGGGGRDIVDSNSATDIIHLGAGSNYVYDRYNPKFGSRTIDTGSNENGWSTEFPGTDATVRIRPPVAGGTNSRITGSGARDGQQDIPNGLRYLNPGLSGNYTDPDDRGIMDIVVLAGADILITPFGDTADNDLLDVTLPAGRTHTAAGDAATTLTISVDGGGYATVQASSFGPVSIHGPWTDLERGFVHRVTRDLMFRFATTPQLDAGQAALEGGTSTRAQMIQGLMNTDEYRGLDVDRVFTKYLRRTSDPSGRTFWINRLREGRALWRFRAQLFGSPEYYNKAGGTNEAYVRRAYSDVLNREPDPSGLNFWVNRLNNGADRGSVALQYLNSAEARRRLVDSQFLRFLDRLPSAAEQDTWVAQIPSNTGEQALIAFLSGSAAYFNRS